MAEKAQKIAVIIGAGPAGLTAALELLRHSDIRPIVLEASNCVGGISRTVNFNGYRMDLGGHRFFSKSDWVMNWWLQILPLEASAEVSRQPVSLGYRNQRRDLNGLAATARDAAGDQVMLLRDRLSRIYFQGKLYDYPLKLNARLLRNLGLWQCGKIAVSAVRARMFPRRKERSLEDFLINRFGTELYRTFFKAYTEKVWGVSCAEISAEWGAQRIKSVSIISAVWHALGRSSPQATPISLVERFLYPRLGPGQLWETAANLIRELGGEIRPLHQVETLELAEGQVSRVGVRDLDTGITSFVRADWVISTMAVKDLIASLNPPAPSAVAEVADVLPYRNFITVGVIAKRMKRHPDDHPTAGSNRLPDNWIYIQEPNVKVGRLQIFNNWSPALSPDPDTVWLGLEYFCGESDELWRLSDADLQALAMRELAQIDLVDAADVLAATVIRVPKAYPAYSGAYAEFAVIRSFVDAIDNLFLVGRNGMHRYNNQDHSMLTAKAAVEIIVGGEASKDRIWAINVDDDYHESGSAGTL